MVKLIFWGFTGLFLATLVVMVFACLKAGSDDDDRYGRG